MIRIRKTTSAEEALEMVKQMIEETHLTAKEVPFTELKNETHYEIAKRILDFMTSNLSYQKLGPDNTVHLKSPSRVWYEREFPNDYETMLVFYCSMLNRFNIKHSIVLFGTSPQSYHIALVKIELCKHGRFGTGDKNGHRPCYVAMDGRFDVDIRNLILKPNQ